MSSRSQTYQIKITLKGSKPRIRRRLLIPSDVMLEKLRRLQ